MKRFPSGLLAVFLAAAAGLALARWTASREEIQALAFAAHGGVLQNGKPSARQTSAAPGTTPLPGALEEQRQWIERLRNATTSDLAQMLLEAQKISDSWRRLSLRELLLEQYARLDPEGGAAFFETFDGRKMHGHFLKAWARIAPVAALAWAQALPDESGRLEACIVMKEQIAEDPEAFADTLATRSGEEYSSLSVKKGFDSLARMNPAQALELAGQLTAPFQRSAAFSSIGEERARREPQAAYEWAKTLTDPAERESALRGVFRSWAETDPQGVSAKLGELSSSVKDAQGESPVKNIVRAWAAIDPKAAADWARGQPGGTNWNELLRNEILPSRDDWSPAELAAILRGGNSKPLSENGVNPLNSVSSMESSNGMEWTSFGLGFENPVGTDDGNGSPSAWHIPDPAKTFAELEKLPADRARQQLLQEAVNQWTRLDRESVLAKAAETSDPWTKAAFINALVNDSAHFREPEDLRKLLGVLGKEGEAAAEPIESSFWAKFAAENPERGERLLREQEDLSANARHSLASSLAGAHAAADPAGALDWAQRQPEEVRAEATAAAITSWAYSDAYEASAWLAAQPPGRARVCAALCFVNALTDSSPEDALPWADALQDESDRATALRTLFSNWAGRSPARATRMLESLQHASPELRQELRNMIPSGGN